MIDIIRDVLGRTDIEGASVYAAHEVKYWPRGTEDRLVAMGLLREIGRAQQVKCFDCPEQCIVDLEWRDYPTRNKPLGVHYCHDEEYGGMITFEPEEARQWAFVFDRLGQLVAEALSLHGDATTVVPDRVRLLGALPTGGGPLDMFLAQGMWWRDATSVIEQSDRLQASAAAVVLVAGRLPQANLWSGAIRTAISLREHVAWNEPESRLDLGGVAALIRGIRPPARAEVWLTVTECARLLSKDLPYLMLDQAKARVSKAASAGKFATNGKQRDARRIERCSFDAWRLEIRDRALDAVDG